MSMDPERDAMFGGVGRGVTLALFDRARDGDVEARRDFVERIEARVIGEVRRRQRPGDRARVDTGDVAHDLFLTLLRPHARPRFESDDDLRRYLTSAITRRLARRFREQGRHGRPEGATRALTGAESPECEPPAGAIARESQAAVRAAIERLPELERRVVTLRVLQGLPLEQIASELGLGVEAVRSRHRRGLRRIRAWLLPEETDPGR